MKSSIFYSNILNNLVQEIREINPDGNCQVISGVLADALFLMIYGAGADELSLERGSQLLEYHLETAEEYILNYKWAHGITGLSWSLSLLYNNNLIAKEVLGEIDAVDDYIGMSLSYDFDLNSYDFATGALGKAHYFLERGNIKGDRYLGEIVNFLYNMAKGKMHNEAYWYDYYTVENPNDLIVNLGLFHGHASIVYFLSKMYKKGIAKEKSEILLKGALNFLERIYFQFGEHLPNKLLFDKKDKVLLEYKTSNIQGWCHGLISNALSFYFGGVVLNDHKRLKLFHDIIIRSTVMEIESVQYYENKEPDILLAHGRGKMNLTFCHGIIGNIFMLNKINKVLKNNQVSGYIDYLEDKLWDICIKGGKLKSEYFYHKGLIAGKSGLALLLIQQLGRDTRMLDKFFLLDLDYFDS